MPLTTSQRQALRGPTVVELVPAGTGLRRVAFGLGHQITTLDRSKLTEPVGRLSAKPLARLGRAIVAARDLESPG